jgi:predicted RNase H-like nuclease (RuvC/YqgF family)
MSDSPTPQIQIWHIDRFFFCARNPRKNDAAVDRMCASIREFGPKIPVLARSDGTVCDGHLRLKSARKLGSWARRRYHRNTRQTLRRVDRRRSESVSHSGEPFGNVG